MATAITTANRDEWLAARRNFITASDAAAILGHSPWRGRIDVWAEKVGQGTPVEETERMRLGRLLEPAILARYAQDTGRLAEATVVANDTLYRSDKYDWLACTPDALVTKGGKMVGLAQAKATSSTASWPDGQPPIYYQIQAAIEMATMDAPWDDFPTLIAGSDYTCPRVERHAAAEDAILAELHEFWVRYVQTGTTPPPQTEADAKVWARMVPAQTKKIVSLPTSIIPTYQEWQEAKAQAALYEKRAKDLQATLLGAQGDAEVGVLPGIGMALKRTVVSVPEKVVKAYTFERFAAAKWKEQA